jgi:hypothetical protein
MNYLRGGILCRISFRFRGKVEIVELPVCTLNKLLKRKGRNRSPAFLTFLRVKIKMFSLDILCHLVHWNFATLATPLCSIRTK